MIVRLGAFLILAAALTVSSQSLTITSPQPSSEYTVGGIMPVEWSASGVGELVVEISTSDGKTWHIVTETTLDPGSGRYDWLIPDRVGVWPAVDCSWGNVIVRIREDYGETSATVEDIYIHQEPGQPTEQLAPQINSVSADMTQGSEPLWVKFTCSASDPNKDQVQVDWDFGDGYAGTGATVYHTFHAGTHMVSVGVSDFGCDGSSRTVTEVFGNITVAPSDIGWEQREFIIGSYIDPELEGSNSADDRAALQKFRDANFNLLTGQQGDPNEQLSYGGNVATLDALADVNGLSILVLDERVNHDNNAVSYSPSAIKSVAQSYLDLSPARREKLYGYSIADEPPPFKTDDEEPLSEHLAKQADLAQRDPSKLGWINLVEWTQTECPTWDDYVAYVHQHASAPSIRVVSYDHYQFRNQNGALGFATPNGSGGVFDDPSYFRHLEFIGAEARDEGKIFWGVAASAESPILWDPQEKHLRYNAFTNVAYGAKGIIWFTYGTPSDYTKTPENSTALYNDIKAVNAELETMGHVVMGLEWLETVHGYEVDPETQEGGLNTIEQGTPVFADANPLTGSDIRPVMVGIHRGGPHHYLTVLNKDLDDINTTTYRVDGKQALHLFDKSSGRWSRLEGVYDPTAESTAFTLTIDPCDMELVCVGPPDITPIIGLLLLD